LAAIAVSVLLGFLALAAGPALAATTTTVELGQASTYAVLSGASVGNTVSAVGAPHTTLRGDLGVKANAQPTGFPPGVVTGTIRVGSAVDQPHADLVTAYDEVARRTGGTALAGDLAGLTLAPGLHSSAAAVANTGTVTLDGRSDPSSIFVFKVGGALTMAARARVTLVNGAAASNVFWQVGGAADIGAGARFAGTLMALDAIAVGAGTEVNGRVLARTGAISLDANEVYGAPPVVTVAGGASAITTDTTPTISGTTDVEAPGVVTVTIAGQTLTATPSDGAWSVTSAILSNGTYPVLASVRDGAGNRGTASQQLTVDTVLPLVEIDGGPSATTDDTTPTIAGVSDVAPGTVVRVSIDSQALTALVQSDGTWNVTTATLSDGTRTVTVSVTDPAGNDGTDSQLLTVDSAPPAMTITGGQGALTNDATPQISGTADVPAGTAVTVTVALQTLSGQVGAGGAWSVGATVLSDGPHAVRATASDAAGNAAEAAQTLTIDTVAPAVAIAGGAAATTSEASPTVAGTSDAAPGTTVSVSIAGQSMTTLIQSDGSWNATPARVGAGGWTVAASVADPAGNVGSASQTLTIFSPPPPAGPTGADGSTGATGTSGTGTTGAPGTTGGTGAPAGTGTGGAPTPPASSKLTLSLSGATFRTVRGRRTALPFAVSGPATVTITVIHRKRAIAKLRVVRRQAGRGSLTWNGRIGRKLAPRGTYRIVARATSPAGVSARDTAEVRVR
jgi:hypothetical protein